MRVKGLFQEVDVGVSGMTFKLPSSRGRELLWVILPKGHDTTSYSLARNLCNQSFYQIKNAVIIPYIYGRLHL